MEFFQTCIPSDSNNVQLGLSTFKTKGDKKPYNVLDEGPGPFSARHFADENTSGVPLESRTANGHVFSNSERTKKPVVGLGARLRALHSGPQNSSKPELNFASGGGGDELDEGVNVRHPSIASANSTVRASHKHQPVRLSSNAILRHRSPRNIRLQYNPDSPVRVEVLPKPDYSVNEFYAVPEESYACKSFTQIRDHFTRKLPQPNPDCADNKLEDYVRKEMNSLNEEMFSRISVYTENGSRFDPHTYLNDHQTNLRRQSKRYSDEIASVSRITTEVEELVTKFIKQNTDLMVRRAELTHKQTQAKDIEFIRPKRFHELELLRRKKKDLEKKERNGPTPRIHCDLKDTELLCMEFAEKLGDTTDKEVQDLAQKAHQYRYILGLHN